MAVAQYNQKYENLFSVVRMLMESGAEAGAENNIGLSPIDVVYSQKNIRLWLFMLERKYYDISKINYISLSSMVNEHEFYDKDYYGVMKESVGVSGAIANRKNMQGYTALLCFVKSFDFQKEQQLWARQSQLKEQIQQWEVSIAKANEEEAMTDMWNEEQRGNFNSIRVSCAAKIKENQEAI